MASMALHPDAVCQLAYFDGFREARIARERVVAKPHVVHMISYHYSIGTQWALLSGESNPWPIKENESLEDYWESQRFNLLATYGDEFEIHLVVRAYVGVEAPTGGLAWVKHLDGSSTSLGGYRYVVEFHHGPGPITLISCPSLPDLVKLLALLKPLCKETPDALTEQW
jgi:hypothetical protein